MDVEQLESYLTERAARDLVSGAVRLSRDAAVLFEGAYGQASRAWGIPNSVDTWPPSTRQRY